MTTVLSRDPARSRPPTDRPLDIVGLELLVCVSQALLAGLLLSLANDLGGDSRALGLPVPGVLAVLGLSVGAAWLWWLVGGSGWPLAAIDMAVALLVGALWLLSIQDASAPHIDPWGGFVAGACAIYGIVAGVFLPGPRRGHWKGGTSRPRRGLPETRTTPARFSPPVQRVVDDRFLAMSLGSGSAWAARMPRVRLPARVATTDDGSLTTDDGSLSQGIPGLDSRIAADPVEVEEDAGTQAEQRAMVHRILVAEESLSVAALRLASDETTAEPVAPDGHDPLDDAEDATSPFPAGALEDTPGASDSDAAAPR